MGIKDKDQNTVKYTNGYSVAALIFSIMSLFFFLFSLINLIFILPAAAFIVSGFVCAHRRNNIGFNITLASLVIVVIAIILTIIMTVFYTKSGTMINDYVDGIVNATPDVTK